MGFGIPAMLLGLLGVAIPVLIHLLNRRRYQIVDWGAMHFLQTSATTRRRILIEEILLMLLRMGLIALLVLALAAPYADSPALAKLGLKINRDVVLLFDGSCSMDYKSTGKSAHERAREWASTFLSRLTAGDSVAVVQAKQRTVPVLGELSHDLERAQQAIAQLPSPRGGADWPQAVEKAFKILAGSKRPQQEIIILTDGQRFGWADENTLPRWELLGRLRGRQPFQPRIRVVNLDPDRPADPPNWSLAPLHASRTVASVGQYVTFRTALVLRGQEKYQRPHRLRLEIDGRPARDLESPVEAALEKGQVPLSFRHSFTEPGSHLVSVIVEPDPPPAQRPPGYIPRDNLPGDNRQDLAIEIIPALPVLIVDGDPRAAPRNRSSDFLRDALSPARDKTPVVVARVVSALEFDPSLLTRDLDRVTGIKPRVLVLCDVARLLTPQQQAVTEFLVSGGGVLVTLGERVDRRHYNDQLYHDGDGWLPARLETIAPDEAKPERGVSPLPSSFFHPALELFREAAGGLGEARFPRWWQVAVPRRNTASVPVALLSNGDPLFVERMCEKGRVILCTVPMDNSWRTNLPELPAFAPLAHELIYYLAGARAVLYNFPPGQPLVYRPSPGEPLNLLALQPPEGGTKPLLFDPSAAHQGYVAHLMEQKDGPVVVYKDTKETGVYRLTAAAGRTVYYVAQPDAGESDLAPCTDAEREHIAQYLPMTYENEKEAMEAALPDALPRQELWWWFFAAVIVLLCSEVWLTRRIVKGR
jgi:von Willebrand factor type A domain/Aerotolerance regulator N-terminal